MSTTTYAQATANMRQRAQGVSKTMTRPPRNNETLYGFVLSVFRREAAGGAKPKMRIVMLLGALTRDPKAVPHPQTGRPARRFGVASDGKSMAFYKPDPQTAPLATELWAQAYGLFDFSVEETEYSEADVGDVVEIRGITCSNWYSTTTGHVSVFTNVDKIAVVPGATRGAYAQDLWLAMRRPIERLRLETTDAPPAGDGDEGPRLGKIIYAFHSFGTDAARAEQYMAQGEYELVTFNLVPEKDKDSPKVDLVTYTPDVFSKATGSFMLENGFKSQGLVDQNFANGSQQLSQVFVTVKQSHLAPLGITERCAGWPALGPILMGDMAYTLLAKENLQRTANEAAAPAAGDDDDAATAGVQFRLIASVQGLLVNVPALLERVAIRVPADRIQELAAAALIGDAPAPASNALVVVLNESPADVLAELVQRQKHDFYLLANMALEEEHVQMLQEEDADKRHLLFDKGFREAVNKAKGQAAKGEVAKRFGLEETSNLPALGMLAAAAKVQLFYAVLKPELRALDYVERPQFQDALTSLLPETPAALQRGAAKRTADEAGLTPGTNGKIAHTADLAEAQDDPIEDA